MFIAFEGPIGVGKTTLAEGLSNRLGARYFADPIEKVSRFLSVASKDALATEMEFLFHRLRQLGDVKRAIEQADQPVVADWDLHKIEYFGRANLNASDFKILREFAHLAGAETPRPDVLVIVESPVDIVLERIKRRGRHYEQEITPQQINEMASRFERIATSVERESKIRVIRFENADGIEASVDKLLSRVKPLL
jgi:deoxyguanosine kinase